MPCRLYKSVKASAGEQLISHYTDKLFKTTAITFDMDVNLGCLSLALLKPQKNYPKTGIPS